MGGLENPEIGTLAKFASRLADRLRATGRRSVAVSWYLWESPNSRQ